MTTDKKQIGKYTLVVGLVLMALAVAMGAVGAHALPQPTDAKMLHRFDLAVSYHTYHALGLILLGFFSLRYSNRWLLAATFMMFCGLGIFCGGLYGLVFTQYAWLSKVVPMGGMLMIGSWLVAAIGVSRALKTHK